MNRISSFENFITDIKKGETWTNKNPNEKIKDIFGLGNGNLMFRFNYSCDNFTININDIFSCERLDYSFEEAIRELRKGKEIECIDTHDRFRLRGDDIQIYYPPYSQWNRFDGFGTTEIMSRWYIND